MPRIPRPSGKAPTGDANVSDSLRPAAMHEVVKARCCVVVAVHDYADWHNASGNCGNSRAAPIAPGGVLDRMAAIRRPLWRRGGERPISCGQQGVFVE